MDWQTLKASAVNEVEENATSGAIVLVHDIHGSRAEALPEVLT
ncbi:hypothetical protein Q9251_22270 [Alkalihalobacillus macyae]|nr:hypothetical protein [Alkalihalobacillus macyae]MDP4553577.1 hypothetical protein [Alkalihalobacillus macyae]